MVANLEFFVIFYSAILTVPYCYRTNAASCHLPKVPESLIEENGPVNSVRHERNIISAQGVVKDEIFTSNRLYLYTRDGHEDFLYGHPLTYSKNQLEFQVKSKQDAHIMLYTHHPKQLDNGHTYMIYMQQKSQKTALRRDGKVVHESEPINLLDPLSYKKVWIKWGPTAKIEVGNPENGTILSYTEADPFTFNYFAVRTFTSGAIEPDEHISAYWIFDRAVPEPGFNCTAFP